MSKSGALLSNMLMPNFNVKSANKEVAKIYNLWQPTDSTEENFRQLVILSQKLCHLTFNGQVDWHSNTWDIRAMTSTVSLRRMGEACNVLFTKRSGLKARQKQSKSAERPLSEPFLSLAKSLVVTAHTERPITHVAHMVFIRAIRYLEEVFELNGCTKIHQLNPGHFTEALKLAIAQGEHPSTLYVTGEKLSSIASRVQELNLTIMPLNWINPIPRSEKHGGSQQFSNTKQGRSRRAEMLPKTAALVFLSALWKHYDELEEKDKALICMAVVLMVCGFRMDEFVSLDINCIPSREEFERRTLELDPISGKLSRILKIRVMARKSYVWDSKIVPPSMNELIFQAYDRLVALSEDHRVVSRTLLEQGKWPLFMEFDDDDLLTSRQVMDIIGMSSTSNTISTLKRYGVEPTPGSKHKHTFFRVGDIHRAFSDAYRERIKPIADGFGMGSLKVNVWDLITLRFKDQYTPKEVLNVFAEPLTGTQIRDFFQGRDYKGRISGDDSRIKSVFERYDFPELADLEPDLQVRTHQFRHLLNTIMQESDQFSQEEIARNFLRSGVKDNAAYNHRTQSKGAAPAIEGIVSLVMAKKEDLPLETAAKLARSFPLLSPNELTRDLDSLGSSHVMDIGRCRHDYVQGPCGLHYACLHNCKHYRRTKGDATEIARLEARRSIALEQMKIALTDAEDGFTGANQWYNHHAELVAGCDAALAVEKDPQYTPGQIVQIFPSGRDSCEVK
ncbi:hypothetical protein JAO78_006685 [Alishewanella sp. 16-MA]|uniref:Integrase n=1 Tax=Alishewanella maricola TaxID=2795740 RepID=A0ABS8C2U1_9ALTE|nr:hypothetical protein [Alishewanella maricola]MCB5226498.1 hypothetical protein [Alishewanella maricola]